MEDPRLQQIAELQLATLEIKRNPAYQTLMSKDRGPSDQKNLEKFRLKISSNDAKIKYIETSMMQDKPKLKPAIRGELRHPANPALQRLATEKKPNGPKNKNFAIARHKMAVDRAKHQEIVDSGQLSAFLDGRPAEPLSSETPQEPAVVEAVEFEDFADDFGDELFYDEPLPDDL